MLWIVAYLLALIVVWAVIEVVRAHALQKVSLKGRPSPKPSTVFGILIGVLVVIGSWVSGRLPAQASVNTEESAQVSNLVQTVARKFRLGPSQSSFGLHHWVLPGGLHKHSQRL